LAQAGLGRATGPCWLNYPAENPCFYGNSACLVVVGRMSHLTLPLTDDPALLKALIAALQAENAKISATLRAHDQLIQTLRLRIAKLKKQVFGQSSEKIEREIEQLELALEDLLIASAESEAAVPDGALEAASFEPAEETADRPSRRRPRVSDNTPRERRELDPGTCCPDCGGDLRVVGEDVSEMLDLIAAQMKVVQIARLKKSCRRCERMVQVPAPSRPIPGSMVGAGLLAHILVSKFDDHLPLYRQHEIFARMGADIPDSTLVDWCGRAMKVLAPLIERIEADVMASDLLHADDTPIRVLDRSQRDKGLGKGVKKGRVWAYTLDYRIAGRQRRMTIGRWPEWNTTAARERAKELLRDIDEGIDPLGLRETSREAPRVNDMIARYLTEHTPPAMPPTSTPSCTSWWHPTGARSWSPKSPRPMWKSC